MDAKTFDSEVWLRKIRGGEFKQKCNSWNAYDLCEFLGDDEICVWIQP